MNASGKFSLRAGVLAAGRGERLRSQTDSLKPLVKVGHRTLIEHVLDSMSDARASEVVVIINEDSIAVRDHVAAVKWPYALRWIVETTPTSMHSFLRLVETLAADGDEGRFFFNGRHRSCAQTYARFIAEARHLETNGRNVGAHFLGRRREAAAWRLPREALGRRNGEEGRPLNMRRQDIRGPRLDPPRSRSGPARRSRCAANFSRASA